MLLMQCLVFQYLDTLVCSIPPLQPLQWRQQNSNTAPLVPLPPPPSMPRWPRLPDTLPHSLLRLRPYPPLPPLLRQGPRHRPELPLRPLPGLRPPPRLLPRPGRSFLPASPQPRRRLRTRPSPPSRPPSGGGWRRWRRRSSASRPSANTPSGWRWPPTPSCAYRWPESPRRSPEPLISATPAHSASWGLLRASGPRVHLRRPA